MDDQNLMEEVKESQPSSPLTDADSQNDVKLDDKISDIDDKITVNSSAKADREGNCYW